MEIREYLEYLLNFYVEVSQRPLVRVVTIDRGLHYQLLSGGLVYKMNSYALGFRIGAFSWITSRLAKKNIKIIEELLAPEYDRALIGIRHYGKYCKVFIFDRYGMIVKEAKIKYLTINWFKHKHKNLSK